MWERYLAKKLLEIFELTIALISNWMFIPLLQCLCMYQCLRYPVGLIMTASAFPSEKTIIVIFFYGYQLNILGELVQEMEAKSRLDLVTTDMENVAHVSVLNYI